MHFIIILSSIGLILLYYFRQTEITRWKIKIELWSTYLQKEIELMILEKKENEKAIEFQNLNFTVTNHCLSLRDERGGEDFCYDIASIELKNVCIV